jgi:fatty-acyl-CoA synthase
MQAQLPHAVQVSNYGMTEMGGYATMHRLDDDEDTRASTGGLPLDGMEFRIVDADGRSVPAGELGEIVARGPQMFAGYFKDDAATQDSADAEGWFHSGDLGRMGADGSVTFATRHKDMLKVGGENVAAAEIETFLVTHPAILIAAVVAAEDERYGQVPAAFVELRDGFDVTEHQVIEFCRGKIATYKVPRYVRFIRDWPMSGTKIQKFRLRSAINDELSAAGIAVAEKITAS